MFLNKQYELSHFPTISFRRRFHCVEMETVNWQVLLSKERSFTLSL